MPIICMHAPAFFFSHWNLLFSWDINYQISHGLISNGNYKCFVFPVSCTLSSPVARETPVIAGIARGQLISMWIKGNETSFN